MNSEKVLNFEGVLNFERVQNFEGVLNFESRGAILNDYVAVLGFVVSAVELASMSMNLLKTV